MHYSSRCYLSSAACLNFLLLAQNEPKSFPQLRSTPSWSAGHKASGDWEATRPHSYLRQTIYNPQTPRVVRINHGYGQRPSRSYQTAECTPWSKRGSRHVLGFHLTGAPVDTPRRLRGCKQKFPAAAMSVVSTRIPSDGTCGARFALVGERAIEAVSRCQDVASRVVANWSGPWAKYLRAVAVGQST